MGHTTRCIPIVNQLLELGHNPIVAGNESQLAYIRETFANRITTTPLEGYNITYSGWNRLAQAGLLSQAPDILRSIKKEHAWLQKIRDQLKLDAVISDNRYGLYHTAMPSVIMTHQLRVMSGMGSGIDRMIQRMHYKLLNRFAETWVVDTEKQAGLGGDLSHCYYMPDHHKYIGNLSRFSSAQSTSPSGRSLLILLSGPEPQRTHLSRILWEQVQEYKGSVVFAEGSDTALAPTHIPTHVRYHKRLGNDALLPILQQADMVICRSGYSTIMDLVALGKSAILIPTPGQTEQEYLGKTLHERGMFYSCPQGGFNLTKSLTEARRLSFAPGYSKLEYDQYKAVIKNWITTI
jgi:hypothetical protein